MEHVAPIITAIVALFMAIGGGIAWLWGRIEARFVKIETALDECREREAQSEKRREKHITVIELLWQEVQRLAPDSGVLIRSAKLLSDLKEMSRIGDGGDRPR